MTPSDRNIASVQPNAPYRSRDENLDHRAMLTAMLSLRVQARWVEEDRLFVMWDPSCQPILQQCFRDLQVQLRGHLLPCCTHLQGHGGVKGTIRRLARCCGDFQFVARFDIAQYYQSIQHDILLDILRAMNVSSHCLGVVAAYLQLPDLFGTRQGLVAGGCLSPLLAAVMLAPLDAALYELRSVGVLYLRYMDDFVILAHRRSVFRRAIQRMHRVLASLRLSLHDTKRFIGRVKVGFDFLGYTVKPDRRLRPSAECIRRMRCRFRQLYEQGATTHRLWQYVSRWFGWLTGGLQGLVSRKGGIRRIFIQTLRSLHIAGLVLPFMRCSSLRCSGTSRMASGCTDA